VYERTHESLKVHKHLKECKTESMLKQTVFHIYVH